MSHRNFPRRNISYSLSGEQVIIAAEIWPPWMDMLINEDTGNITYSGVMWEVLLVSVA